MTGSRFRLIRSNEGVDAPARKRPLGRLLVERGLINTSDVLVTLGHQRVNDAQLGHLLIAQGLIQEADLFETLALQNAIPFVCEESTPPDLALQKGLEPHKLLRLGCVPWCKRGGITLIATSSPEHFEQTRAQIPAHLHPIEQAIAPASQITEAIRAYGDAQLAARAELLVPEHLSCRNLPTQLLWLLGTCVSLLIPALVLDWISVIHLYRVVFLFAVAMVCTGMLLKMVAAGLALYSRLSLAQAPPAPSHKLPRVSILIPLHDESEILNALLQRIGMLNYPKALLEVILVIEDSDKATRAHLEAAELPNWMRTLIVPPGNITTKPRAMNYALPFCGGEIVGIYDAEDAPHPDQITEVATLFANEPQKTACVQAVLDFYNAKSNALARFFAIEYATWFRLVLPGVSQMGFAIPLGGTSVFFRRDVLEKLNGWDAHNVTEDADLGIRLARAGYQTKLITSETMEEANNKTWPWIKQRSRWLKGYLITYFTHMRRPLRLLIELGPWQFFGFQAFFLSSISQYMLAPLIWSCFVFYWGAPAWMQAAIPPNLLALIIMPFIAMWVISTVLYMLAVSGPKHRHLVPWTLLMSPYMVLGTLAIYKGAWELITRPFYWEKTAHGHSDDIYLQASSEVAESNLSLVTKATEM